MDLTALVSGLAGFGLPGLWIAWLLFERKQERAEREEERKESKAALNACQEARIDELKKQGETMTRALTESTHAIAAAAAAQIKAADNASNIAVTMAGLKEEFQRRDR